MTDAPHRQERGQRRREALVAAAAEIILSEGPAAVTHRTVARRAGSSLSATTYYFADIAELVGAAGARIMAAWAAQAERVAAAAEAGGYPSGRSALLDALLPPPGEIRGHYQQLLVAGATPALATAYRRGRRRLDAAVGRILRAHGSSCPPKLAVAVVDGAVVSALSEGRDVRKTADALLASVL